MGEASALSAMKKGFKDVLSLQHIALVRISKYVKLGSKTQTRSSVLSEYIRASSLLNIFKNNTYNTIGEYNCY